MRRNTMATGLLLSTMTVAGLAACAPAVAPLPPPATTPAPAGGSDPPAPPTRGSGAPGVRLSFARTLPTARYEVRSRARYTVDSAGTPVIETVESSGSVTVAGERTFADPRAAAPGALRVTGQVADFVLAPSARLANARASALPGVATTPGAASLAPTVAFEGTFDGTIARLAPVPAPANECDQPAVAATALARDLLVRLPATLAVGDSWRDTTRVFACRGGVPLTIETVSTVRVLSIEPSAAGDAVVQLERRVILTVAGDLTSAWRVVSIAGSGSGRYELRVLVPSGIVDAVSGTTDMRFETKDSVRPGGGAAVVHQEVAVRATRRP